MTKVSTLAKRIIARLDIKGPNLVKGIQLEGLRVMGDPAVFAKRYYEQGADELLYFDIVASLYERNNLTDVVARTASELFVPLCVGGGIRTPNDVQRLLRAGADKVAINTGAVRTPALIDEAVRAFGSQAIVVSIEAKRQPNGTWEAYTDNGRERTGLDAVAWAMEAVDRGAGEILVTSVDREGTRKGFDMEVVARLAPILPVPFVISGGAGAVNDVADAAAAGVDGVAVASLLHYGTTDVPTLKGALAARSLSVRDAPAMPVAA